jgi:hypothetical protein
VRAAAIATAISAAGGGVYVYIAETAVPTVIETIPAMAASGAPDTPPPAELRQEAFRHRAWKSWLNCVDVLDKAREADPDGERDPQVKETREECERELAKEPNR